MKIHYNGNDKEIKQTIILINELEQQLNQVTNRMQEVMSERLENQEELIEKRLTEERNRLARELHDSVSQELFAASMLVSAVKDRKSTRLNSSHVAISYAVFCLKKKKQ